MRLLPPYPLACGASDRTTEPTDPTGCKVATGRPSFALAPRAWQPRRCRASFVQCTHRDPFTM